MNKIYIRLAKTNIFNNKQLYLPYILSGIMTVAMFYIMLFLSYNEGLDRIPGALSLRTIMALGVIVIGIFAYIFLFYTNSFIIKRRKKEIGVYNILGMEKRHIAKVLMMETLFVACVAIVGGLFTGIVFSKLMVMLLYKILGFEESIAFTVSGMGIVVVLIVFGVLYLLTLLYNLMQIKLANPIELLRGGHVGEKEPKTKLVMALLGLACIVVAYYIAITTESPLEVLMLFFLAVLLVIVGTYLLFIAGSIVVLKVLRKNKKFYYNKKHFAAVSGMLYRMKQNAAGLASICILSTMVLIMVSTTVSMFAGVDDELVARYPMDIMVYASYDVADVDGEELNQDIYTQIEKTGRKIVDNTSYDCFYMYMDQSGDSFQVNDNQTFDGKKTSVNVMTRENLLAMDRHLAAEDVPEVPTGSVLVYADNGYHPSSITMMGQEYPVEKAVAYQSEQDLYTASMFNGTYYVIADSEETVKQLYARMKETCPTAAYFYRNITAVDIDGTSKEKIDAGKTIQSYVDTLQGGNMHSIYAESREANAKEFFTVYGGLFFLGIFLGVMFLMVTVMIIFYKQISEGYDDKERYQIMEKVGMSNLEVKRSIQSQVRMVFFLPILTAAVHVCAAFPMVRRLLALLNLTNVGLFVRCLGITFVIFLVIYYVVFRVTSRAYYKIVGEQVNR